MQSKLGVSLLLAASILAACAPAAETPAVVEPGPPELGALMAWADSSTLVYIQRNDVPAAPEYMWVFQSEVSNYQFSLCMEAGGCQLPVGESPLPDLGSPTTVDAPAQIIGPDVQEEYCSWAKGKRLPDVDAAQMARKMDANGHPLYTSTEHGFRCAVDSPHTMPAACETSAFYLNGPPAPMEHDAVVQRSEFCQNSQGFATGDIDLPGCELQSVNGGAATCQQTEASTVLCFGEPGTSVDGEAELSCNGFLPALQESGLPDAGEMACVAGYVPAKESPAQCTFSPAVQSYQNPLLVQASLVMLTCPPLCQCPPICSVTRGGALLTCPRGSHLGLVPSLEGGGLVQACLPDPRPPTSRCPDGSSWDAGLKRCVRNDLVDWPHNCPLGTYLDSQTGFCVPPAPAPSPNSECLGGYQFDQATQCCRADLPSGDYPGCPTGQAYDPLTGTCDAENTWTAHDRVLRTVEFTFLLPACLNEGSGGPGNSGGSACDKITDKTKCYAAGCTWNGKCSK